VSANRQQYRALSAERYGTLGVVLWTRKAHADAVLSKAVVVWTGRGSCSWPLRDDDRVIERFGTDRALDLLPAVRRLKDEFYESDASRTVANLVEMGDAAATRFRRLHPEVSEEAVQALAWCYAYDYK
jgi:hypothetical protein